MTTVIKYAIIYLMIDKTQHTGKTKTQKQLMGMCTECGGELFEEQSSQDADGNRQEFIWVCPNCDF